MNQGNDNHHFNGRVFSTHTLMRLPLSNNEHGCDTKYNVDITLLNIKSCPLQHIGQPYSSQKRQAEKERREDVIRGKIQTTQHKLLLYT
jgi:hypothetical protein